MYWFIVFFLLSQNSFGAWEDIAYDKRFDEMTWAEILPILESEKKHKVVAGILNEHSQKLTQADYQYYFLWSQQDQLGILNPFMQTNAALSSREFALRFSIYWGQKNQKLTFAQVHGIKAPEVSANLITALVDLELWDLAEEKFMSFAQNNKVYSFQVMELLEKIKQKSDAKFVRFLQIFKVIRPQDELGHQLWIESIFQSSPYAAWGGLNVYCMSQQKFCYNSIELARDLGFNQAAARSRLYLVNEKEYLKTLLHQLIDDQNYLGILSLRPRLVALGLLEDLRYLYAIVYAAYTVGDCQTVRNLRSPLAMAQSYQARLEQIDQSCQIGR